MRLLCDVHITYKVLRFGKILLRTLVRFSGQIRENSRCYQ